MHVYNEHEGNYKHECENATTVSIATQSNSIQSEVSPITQPTQPAHPPPTGQIDGQTGA